MSEEKSQLNKKTCVSSIMFVFILMTFVFFCNYHAIFIKTGTPMFKYGLAMNFLQPFYSIWSVWVVLAKYVLQKF